MSRHPSSMVPGEQNLAEDYVNYICTKVVPKAMTLEEIKQETKHDAEMQAVIKAVESDQWSNQELQNYKKLKEGTIRVQRTSA